MWMRLEEAVLAWQWACGDDGAVGVEELGPDSSKFVLK